MDADRTDEELVASVRQGDDRAFEALWQRYHRRIAAYVNGMVNDHARAEDITQDVFMSALRRIRDTDRPIAFKPWIYEIAKNACIDAFRRSRRAEEVSYDAEGGLGSADQGRLVSSTPTPDVAVDTRMSLDNLRGAFGGLSETHHDILVMRELEGLSYREIGERLGMSRPSVESTLFRARRRLTEEYEELISGERCRRMQALIVQTAQVALGTRDARRMARHVSHCQPCRRAAVAAGLDLGELVPRRPLREKIAALLPIPAFLKRRFGGDEAAVLAAPAATNAHTVATVVAQYVEPAALSGWAKAAAAAATVAIAGVGAGVATDQQRVRNQIRDEAGVGTTAASAAQAASAASGTAAAAAAVAAAAAQSPDGGSVAAIARRDRETTTSADGRTAAPGTATASASTTPAAGGPAAAAGTQAAAPRPSLSDILTGTNGSGASTSGDGSSGGTSGSGQQQASANPKLPSLTVPSAPSAPSGPSQPSQPAPSGSTEVPVSAGSGVPVGQATEAAGEAAAGIGAAVDPVTGGGGTIRAAETAATTVETITGG